MNSENSGLLLK